MFVLYKACSTIIAIALGYSKMKHFNVLGFIFYYITVGHSTKKRSAGGFYHKILPNALEAGLVLSINEKGDNTQEQSSLVSCIQSHAAKKVQLLFL